tara:strand:- start:3486 stop:4028 length:543 start_codon:yes stop_codon:yes gene_type:complete
MHDSAMWWGKQFLNNYSIKGKILEVGSCRQIRQYESYQSKSTVYEEALRDQQPKDSEWIGADISPGPGVDVVLKDPHILPFPDGHFDASISSSVYEHVLFPWELFKEQCRCVKVGGHIYINAPSSGDYHPYPIDAWRFYLDSARSLQGWAAKAGYPVFCHHASTDAGTHWNDFVAVYIRE